MRSAYSCVAAVGLALSGCLLVGNASPLAISEEVVPQVRTAAQIMHLGFADCSSRSTFCLLVPLGM